MKVPGAPNAVGYWGRNPRCRVEDDQTGAKVRALLQDQLLANGRPVKLWQPVSALTPGVVPCTCDKNTTQNSDYKCMSCFGAKLVPGYQRFMYATTHFSSAEAGAYTLTSCVVDTTKKPNRITLAANALTGSFVTNDKPFVNMSSEDWELELVAFRKAAGDTVALEFSTDSGVTWNAVALTYVPVGPATLLAQFGTFRGALTVATKPYGTGSLRVRVTLTRASATTLEGPSFEVLRLRHVRRLDANPASSQGVEPGEILILKTWDAEAVGRLSQGRVIEYEGDRAWTSPLDFYDLSITPNTPPAALDDREAGPHPFFEYTSSVRAAQRFAIKSISLDDQIGEMLTHQDFTERRAQYGEVYFLVW